ncbi:spermatogenesis-associated protein 22 isoform X2 [Stegostoma tigrinum]|uniref:spermatogenesis-associated protein 22 isoform X2 n=1 Tax=Stegostoma tigrinum TaxID=3053191 RepID=UPI00202B127A|nr:spermatogenesis-associated protein 22 isoform X2 [Stegostoma tigrinum]
METQQDRMVKKAFGCLPVLLFNQKKRTRLPLTSNPMEHEPGSNNLFPTPESFDSPPAGDKGLTQNRAPGNQTTIQNNYRTKFQYPNMRTNIDNSCSGMTPGPNSGKCTNTGQLQQHSPQYQQVQEQRKFSHESNITRQNSKNSWNQLQQQVPPRQQRQVQRQFSGGSNIAGQSKMTGWNTDDRQQSGNTWKENCRSLTNERTECTSNGNNHIQTKITSNFRSCVPSESCKAQEKSSQQTHQWPKSSSQPTSSKRGGQLNPFIENQFENNPSDVINQKSQPVHVRVMQPDNSLRIVTTSIEGMKYWTQYNHKCGLLFEVIATLDSAVRAGEQSAKNFLLRDRNDSVPSVFYEMDRDLPRLIRGQAHRCMGTYDQRRNLFKCVSVRPASVVEQNTFAEFVSVADTEMTQFARAVNEL